jgi:hypothetical protein
MGYNNLVLFRSQGACLAQGFLDGPNASSGVVWCALSYAK